MTHTLRYFILGVLAFVFGLGGCLIAWKKYKPKSTSPMEIAESSQKIEKIEGMTSSTKVNDEVGQAPKSETTQSPYSESLFPAGPSQGLDDPRWKKWSELERKDKDFEWKTPIRFYGKVVDEEGKPVEGATVRLGWNSMKGSEERVLTSNAQGEFSVEGIQGKVMTVKPSKEGYHFSRHQNQTAFEYSAFFEPHYHVPDPERPTVFKMVKIGKPEPMVLSRQSKPLRKGEAISMDLGNGIILEWQLMENRRSPALAWTSRIRLLGGHLKPCLEEFPQRAPKEGYLSEFTIDETTKKPPNWLPIYQGGLFYVKSDSGYGLLKVEMMGGGTTAHVRLAFNPTLSGNVETKLLQSPP